MGDLNKLDRKINEHFPGMVVRKDLVNVVKGNAIVPTYVLEYLLGQYCATADEDEIKAGVETVKKILSDHYVHRNESELIKSKIKEKGSHKVIDKIRVNLNDDSGAYEAEFSNLGIKKVLIDSDTVKRHKKLLVGGVWCIADIEYQYNEDKRTVPWMLASLKPVQMSSFDLDEFLESRSKFNMEEWVGLLLQTIGLNPNQFPDLRTSLLQLVRLIPYCEKNYNLIELGPKGTGKSHIYSEFSPHGILISGGEVSVPKLFVNNSTGKIGLVGYWSVVAFDEFAGKKKKANRALVDILKNYLANKTFSRGKDTIEAEASMAFVGNTASDVPYMLMHNDLFDELPEHYHDSAFLDRIHFYLPGWEVEVLRSEMFSDGYGFVVDYLAEVLRHFREFDYSNKYEEYFEIDSSLSIRDKNGIKKTFSGLMNILYPTGNAPKEDVEIILKFAIEGRKRVKDQLMRIDTTYPDVNFAYIDISDNEKTLIKTAEEISFPDYYYLKPNEESKNETTEIPENKIYVESPVNNRNHSEIIGFGEGSQVEFKSTLRWNLKTKSKDSRLTFQCLKTVVAFLNTDGGTLFVGVRDNGQPVGLAIDGFENEDKLLLFFGNMLNDRIGSKFGNKIRYALYEIGGVDVLRVDCERSSTPVYLKDKSQELFYTRNGASTAKLTTSEAVHYIKNHYWGD
jgi:ATP-dependent Lon protease